MKTNRLIEIIFILTERKKVTARELAEKFGVSVRTIYRDIDALSSSNIPLYTEKGTGGGIFILPEYVFNKTLLSEDEQNNILIGLQSLKATGYPQTDEIIGKISNMFNKENYEWIEVDFTSWGSSAQDEKFNILKDSVLEKRMIEFKYFNSYGEFRTRRVEPVKLIFKHSSWYLKAFCLEKKDIRMYKISRMMDLQKTDVFFTERKQDTALNYNWGAPSGTIEAELLFKLEFAYRVYDDFNPKHITHNPDGTLTVKTSVPCGSWFYDLLLFYGDNVTILGSPELKENYINLIDRVYKKYH